MKRAPIPRRLVPDPVGSEQESRRFHHEDIRDGEIAAREVWAESTLLIAELARLLWEGNADQSLPTPDGTALSQGQWIRRRLAALKTVAAPSGPRRRR